MTTTDERQLITIQVFVDADPGEAENVAVRATNYIEESFVDTPATVNVQTVLVHSGPFTYNESGIVTADKANAYTGGDD